MKICVFGAASNRIDSEYIRMVEILGEMMAKRGHSLVFGAGACGLMGAAARGVKRGGGEIFGIIPDFFRAERIESIYSECTELIYTDSMRTRKQAMEDMADAFIIVPGGIGTFEEFYEVLTLKQLRRHNKPIAIYNLRNYYDSIDSLMQNAMNEGFVTRECEKLFDYFTDAEAMLQYVEENAANPKQLQNLKEG